MKCAIMQPTYYPWAGYLNLMLEVDCFVYLDDAQFERSSWHHRNKILLNGQQNWLTVPVRRGRLGASIQEVVVDDSVPWRRKHLTMLSNAYARHIHVKDMLEITEPLSTTSIAHLSDLNITLLDELRRKLRINTPIITSSSLDVSGTRTQRLIEILNKLGATDYISPPGALDYLKEDRFIDLSPARLWAHNFQPPQYQQRNLETFVSHLSILDVAANLGWEGTQNYIRQQSNTVRIY